MTPMNGKNFESTSTIEEKVKRESTEDISEYNYEQYQDMGGIINEKDYQNALNRARDTVTLNKVLILQAEGMAELAGITLLNSEGVLDPRIILYGILRTDVKPGNEYHHSQMSDQRLFAEALRMLEDVDSLQKLIEAYPNILFN